MSDATPGTPVETLRSKLAELSEWSARCKEAAEQAANALNAQPSVEGLRERDRQRELAEVADLEVERVKRALREAEEQARQDAIVTLIASQSPIQERAGTADDAVWRSLGEHEAALETLLGCRQELKKLNARLMQLGYEGDAIQPCPRPQQNEYRTEGLVKSYNQATHPLGVMPVRMSE